MEQNKNEMINWKDLFSLYRDLVKPFQTLENRLYRKQELEWTAGSAKETINSGYAGTIRSAFLHTLKWSIPFLGIFWMFGFFTALNAKSPVTYYNSLTEDLIEAINDILDGGWIFELVAYLIFDVLLPCLFFLFPLMIVVTAISRAYKISQAKKTLKACEKQLPQAETAVREAYKSIAPYVEKVPPNYRNSSALAFFSDSFFNFKVRNLQEAVNLYDQYLHQQRMEQGQREMAQAQKDAMDDISRQLDYLHDQMDSMEADINALRYY